MNTLDLGFNNFRIRRMIALVSALMAVACITDRATAVDREDFVMANSYSDSSCEGELKETAKLVASDAMALDFFGTAVDIHGDAAIAGAQFDDDLGAESGSAYIFQRNGAGWIETSKLTANDGATQDRFGHAVAMENGRALVGAYRHDKLSGAAYVYEFNGSAWNENAILVAVDAAAGDQFAHSVDCAGEIIIVGAPGDDVVGSNSGSAYLFSHDGLDWVQFKKLVASDAAGSNGFGYAVAIDGMLAVVGAIGADNSLRGAAYIFANSGSDWTEVAKLTASDAAPSMQFGFSVAISGSTVVIGTNGQAAYVFEWNGLDWTEAAKLVASDVAPGDLFGNSVSIHNDTIVVSSARDDDDGADSGSAYVFKKTDFGWTEDHKLTASDAISSTEFGSSVATDGLSVIVGAVFANTLIDDTGAAYIFECAFVIDTDGDGVPDDVDNCPGLANPDQIDCNKNGIGDVCDIAEGFSDDINNDGVPDECTIGDCNLNSVPDAVELSVQSYIYWADNGWDQIRRANLDGSNVQTLVSGYEVPDGLAIDLAGGKIYFSDRDTPRILRCNLSGSSVQTLINSGLDGPGGIALDLGAQKMYWVDGGTQKVQRANLDGSNIEDLVTTGLILPNRITLNIPARKMYWTDRGTLKIQRANLDGSNVEDVLTGLIDPRGLTLDLNAGKMYWMESTAGKIMRANLDGTSVEELVAGISDGYDIALDLFARKMYWGAAGSDDIHRANLDGSVIELIVPFNLALNPRGLQLTITSPDCNQNDSLDECDVNNGTSLDINENGVPDECEFSCPADIAGPAEFPDGVVNVWDLFHLLVHWGTFGPGADLAPPNDEINVADLFMLLAAWGDCN